MSVGVGSGAQRSGPPGLEGGEKTVLALLVRRHREELRQPSQIVSPPRSQAWGQKLLTQVHGSLAGKWQWVIGICKWYGHTVCFNNQDPKRRSLIRWRERNRRPRSLLLEPEERCSAQGTGTSGAEALGEFVSPSQMPRDL